MSSEYKIAVVVFNAMFCKQRQYKGGNGMPEGAYDGLLCNLSTSWLVASSPPPATTGRMPLATIGNPSINQYLQILVGSSVRNATTLQYFPMLCHFSAFADACVYFCPTAEQKVPIFLICSSAGDGRCRQWQANTSMQKHLF